jgi:hypothetical protein
MTNDELNETACRGLPALPLAHRAGSPFVGRARHSVRAALRISSFTSSFHIANRREARDRLADSGQLSRCDHFIDVLVSATCFLSETCP